MAKRPSPNATDANLGIEAKLWQAADASRNNVGPARDCVLDHAWRSSGWTFRE